MYSFSSTAAIGTEESRAALPRSVAIRIARRGTLFLSTVHGEREVERTLAAADAAFRRLPEA